MWCFDQRLVINRGLSKWSFIELEIGIKRRMGLKRIHTPLKITTIPYRTIFS